MQTQTTTGQINRLVFLRGFVCFLVLSLLAGCQPAATVDAEGSAAGSDSVVAGTVQLVVNFSSDRKNLDVKVPCSADSTVFKILQRAQNMGDLEFDSQGAGETVFVHSIDGVMNAGARGKNWVFRVNDELAHESCGSVGVVPGDVIEWKFGDYEPE